MIFPFYLEAKILKALFDNHPYEEVAYETFLLENYNDNIGMGLSAYLPKKYTQLEFLKKLKSKMNLDCIRHTELTDKMVEKIAFVQGSGSFAINKAMQKGVDVLISADFKYHDFINISDKILLVDIGHFESEKFVVEYLHDKLKEKMPNFEFIMSNFQINPINYMV